MLSVTPNEIVKFKFSKLILVILLFLPVFSSQIFFSIAGLLGVSYKGSEDSKLFILYSAIVLLITIISFIFYIVRRALVVRHLYFFLFVNLFLLCCILMSLTSDFEFLIKELGHFLLLGLPGAFAGLMFYKLASSQSIVKHFECFFLIFSYVFVFTVLRVLLTTESFAELALGGANYQFISYTACLLYGILLYLSYYRGVNSFHVTRFSFLHLPLFFFLPAFVFFSGSKGAALLFLLYSLIFSSFFFLKRPKSFIFIVLAAILLVFYYIENIGDKSLISVGLNRILIFFHSDSTIENRSSGRLEYYNNFIFLIKNSPVIGYGAFVDNGYVTNSHNFFSMVFLNFGVLFGFLFISFNFYLLSEYIKYLKCSEFLFGLTGIFLVFLFVSLSFSGSYLKSPIYWFVFSVLFCLAFRRVKQI